MLRAARFSGFFAVALWSALAHADPGMYTCEGSYTIVKKYGPFGDIYPPKCGPVGSQSVIYYIDLAHYKCSDNTPTSGFTDWNLIDPCSPTHDIQVYCGDKCFPRKKAIAKATGAACGNDPSPDSCVGDPVDLVTGYLEQQVTDIDLGHRLGFTRFYTSGRTSAAGQLVTNIGRNWKHNLQIFVSRFTNGIGMRVIAIRPPFDIPQIFTKLASSSDPFVSAQRTGGSVVEETDGTLRWTDASGSMYVFDSANKISSISHVGEPAISVTHGADTSTYTNGLASMVMTFFPTGHANAGKVSSVSANGETTSFTYGSYDVLLTATAPDQATASTSDTILTEYTYDTVANSTAPARLGMIERTARGVTDEIGHWTVNTSRQVTQADERALDQLLNLSYTTGSGGWKYTTAKDASNATLATYGYKDGQLLSVTGSGGPGVEPPFASATYAVNSEIGINYRTKTDQNGDKTYFGFYAREHLPGLVVDGWVDGSDPNGAGIFSADDSYLRRRNLTYHPTLAQPLAITEASSLTGALDRITVFDFDDPNAVGDDPNTPNQAPTQLMRKLVRKGKTLDPTGATVDVQAVTEFAYNAQGDVTSIEGPRAENYTEHLYAPTTGYRTATRRYLNGPGSSYLETAYSNFDARGNPQIVTDANGRDTAFTYDGLDRVLTATPPWSGGGSSTVTMTWDVDGRLTRIDFPNDSFNQSSYLRMGYTSKDSPSFVADAQGNAVVFEYTKNRKTREARYTGFVDLSNRGTLVGDATYSFNSAGRLFRAFNPLFTGNTVYTEYGYDGDGNPIDVTDENVKHDDLLYDKLDRLLEIEQVRTGGTFETGFAYDPASAVTQITDPAAKETEYLTDDLGRLVKVVSPDTGTTLYLHDLSGNTTGKIEAFGTASERETSYAYDGLDRLTLVNHPNDADWAFTYDGTTSLNQKGRVASVTNGTVTTSFEYTARGEVAVERTAIDGKSYDVDYGYDAAGNIASIAGPSGVAAMTSFQGQRPKTVAITAGTQTETIRNLEFQPFGGRTRADFPPYNGSSNVVLGTRAYNLRGQVTEIDVSAPTGTVLDRSLSYDYTAGSPGPNDPGPNLDRIVDNRDSNQSRFYFYDVLDRLASAKTLAGSSVEGYLYDGVGNRTQKTTAAGTTTYSYESGTDRLLSASGPEAKAYAHDAYGSRIYMGSDAYSGTPSLVYNDENRLVQAKDADASFAVLGTYTYDAFGRRVKKVAGDKTEFFFYDLAGHTIEILEVKTGTDHVRDLVFVEDEPMAFVDQDAEVGTALGPVAFDFDGRMPAIPLGIALGAVAGLGLLTIPAVRRRPKSAVAAVTLAAVAGGFGVARSQGGGATFYWIHTDHLGTPLALTNTPATPALATAVWRVVYTPFGEAAVDEDPDGDLALVSLSLRFPGQLQDPETGLQYNFLRTYDSRTGRYLEVDLIGQGGGLNLFGYARGIPVGLIDPVGLDVAIVISRQTYSADGSITASIGVQSDRHGNRFDGFTVERISNVDPETGVDKLALAAGTYPAFLRLDRRLPRVELMSTPGYKYVQIHAGRSIAAVQGCFAAGDSLGAPGEVLNSPEAMRLIGEIIRQDATGNIKVTIDGANNMTPIR